MGSEFSDIPDGAWYLTYARWAIANRIITADGETFNPAGTVTRADAAAMLIATFSHLAAADSIEGIFADTGHISQTAAEAIEGIHAAGLTKGCTTEPLRYCPHRAITRAQTAVMLARAIQRAKPTVGLIVNEPEAARGYALINTRLSDEVYLIDHLGRKVHTWRLEGYSIRLTTLLETGNLMIFHNKADQSRWIAEVDPASNTVWEYPAADAHHDFLVLPNGNILLLMRNEITTQEAIAAGADLKQVLPGKSWQYDYLREIKPTGPDSGEIVWEWSTLDHLVQDHDPDKPNYGPIAGHPRRIDINYALRHRRIGQDSGHDWIHINAIDYNPVFDQIMLSARNFSELWIIDHNTTTEEAAESKGDLLYRWGNPRAHSAGSYGDQQLFWQHYTHWIPLGLPGAGNTLIFNNGHEFTGLQRNYSSVDEIALPAPEGDAYPRNAGGSVFAPARPQWTHITDIYAPYGSGAQRLSNGNTLTCIGNSLVQVTQDGTTVWKYVNPVPVDGPPAHQGDNAQNAAQCRTPWYPLNYPGLKGMDLTPQGPIELYR